MLKLIEINCKFHAMNVVSNKMLFGLRLGSGHALLVFFMFYNGEKPFWVGDLFDQLFQPTKN